ncbi:hypothetical protein Tco_0762411 [Tanacetum coccineum]
MPFLTMQSWRFSRLYNQYTMLVNCLLGQLVCHSYLSWTYTFTIGDASAGLIDILYVGFSLTANVSVVITVLEHTPFDSIETPDCKLRVELHNLSRRDGMFLFVRHRKLKCWESKEKKHEQYLAPEVENMLHVAGSGRERPKQQIPNIGNHTPSALMYDYNIYVILKTGSDEFKYVGTTTSNAYSHAYRTEPLYYKCLVYYRGVVNSCCSHDGLLLGYPYLGGASWICVCRHLVMGCVAIGDEDIFDLLFWRYLPYDSLLHFP